MKLHVLSDLHLGCAPFELEVRGDALILAGDITDGRRELLLPLTAPYRRQGLPVVFVPGNHEFYGQSIERELLALSRLCRRAGIELLHNRTIELQGVRIAGATLWTDFQLYANEELGKLYARNMMADFTAIRHLGRTFTPDGALKLHQRALRFFERVFKRPYAGPTVVVTHHGPHVNSIHARFERHPLNPGFVSDLSLEILRWRPALWAHGHVHNRFDYTVGTTRIVANPRGYDQRYRLDDGRIAVRHEHEDFDPGLLIEVG